MPEYANSKSDFFNNLNFITVTNLLYILAYVSFYNIRKCLSECLDNSVKIFKYLIISTLAIFKFFPI